MGGNGRERGAVMVWALIFVIVTAGMIISHSAYMASHRRTMDVQLKRKPLAATLARAALTDGLSWFQAQPTQPVTDFAPRQDLTANPPVIDTIDPDVGLVREFEIRGSLWGRYEIRREEATDVSKLHGGGTAGSVWRLGARGYVYRVVDPSKPFNEAPNRIVSTSRVETTLRSVPLNLPAAAAIDIDDLSKLTIGPGGKVHGGGSSPGVAGPPPGGLLTALLNALAALVTGSPKVLTVPTYKSAPTDVFRMTLAELRDISDVMASGTSDRWLRSPLASDVIVYHDGDLTITPGTRLAGAMLLVVNGNLIVQPGTNSAIEGIIYVTGNTELRGPMRIDGALIAKGNVLVQGNGAGQDAVVQFDAGAVQRVVQSLARYRASRTTRGIEEQAAGTPTAAPTVNDAVIDPTADIRNGVTIGDNVVIERRVTLEERVAIGANSTVREEATLKKRATIGTGVQIGRYTMIEDYALIGDGAVLGDKVKVGAGARVAPGAVVPDGTVIPAGVSYP